MTYSEKLKDPRWQKKRLEVFQRDGFSCNHCGNTQRTLHVHHISYSKEPWDTHLDMLTTLCDSCHLAEEDNLKSENAVIFNKLRSIGFTSSSFRILPNVFEKDRGWSDFDPAFDILKMVVDDDSLWESMKEMYFKNLINNRG